MENKIVVLMSTYNGEKYLIEQIDSIMNQNFDGDIFLQIRDDGSKDSTIDIIESYSQSDNRKIKLDIGENIGPQRSFLRLIKNAAEADYYFFADQDDIWNLNKVRTAVSKMEDCKRPVCYCSNYSLFNLELGINKERVLETPPIFRPLKVILFNQIPGCTMGFNDELMKLIKNLEFSNVMMHDSMTLALCAACGKVIYDDTSTIRHRIHDNNVVGEGHKKIILPKWLIEKLKLLVNKDNFDLSEMADQFIKTGKIKLKYLEDICLLRDYKKTWKNTFKLLKHPDSHGVFMDRTTISIRCKILFHVF